MDLHERIYFDEKEKVLMADLSNLNMNQVLIRQIFDLEIEIAKKLSEKPYLVVNWQNVEMSPEFRDYYARRLSDLMQVVKGIVRYDVNVFITKLGLQAENISRGSHTNIFKSKEEALQAIREGRV